MIEILFVATKYVMPVLLVVFSLLLVTKPNLIDSFVKGAKDGAVCCFNLLPTFLLIMCAVSALFVSGTADFVCKALKPVLDVFSVPEEILPSIVLRPFSGSAVTAIADKLFKENGADNRVSKIACILMGSTDTIIYTLGVYFSSANIKRTRYALPASFVVFMFSVFICVAVGNYFV